MGAPGDGYVDDPWPQDPWRVRVHDRRGAVLGAGILVADRRVLTCAHNIPDGAHTTRDWPLSVRVLGDGRSAVPARVADGGLVPVSPLDSDMLGDLALLELNSQVRVPPAVLRRQFPLPGRRVRLCGYPAERDAGVWVDASVAGPSGPWFQLNLDRVDDVQPGFSGAGVFDPTTNAVIGMVVAKPDSWNQWPICYMAPMSGVVGCLPVLRDVVAGAGSADASFATYRETVLDRTLVEPVHRLVGALTSTGDGRLVLAYSAHDERRAAAFGLLITTADREIRAGLRTELLAGPRASLAKVGSVDLAVDATGRTTRDVVMRLAGYVGIPVDDPKELVHALGAAATALTVVVESVDDAVEPVSLFTDLLLPLAAAGVRVLAGARSADLPKAAAAYVTPVDLDAPDTDELFPLPYVPNPDRLDRLDQLVAQTAAVAKDVAALRADTARRIRHVRPFTDHVASLRLKVADLRRQIEALPAHRGNEPAVHEAIAAAERRAQEVGRHAERFREVLEEARAKRDELRGRLDGYHRIHLSLGEHPDLSDHYGAAFDLLWIGSCDLDVAEAAVAAYQRAVDGKRGNTR